MTAIRLLGDRVLVALPPKETESDPETGYTVQPKGVSAGGIILAKPTEAFDVEIATRGIVMQLGEKRGQVNLDDVRAELHEYFLRLDEHVGTLGAELRAGRRPGEAWSLRKDVSKVRDEIDGLILQMRPAPFDVAVGDCVVFSSSAGDQFTLYGINYVILREAEILGVVAPISEAA